ncbi:MAG: class IV adenylate cyclase [Acidobacteriaceae bacterium]
MTIEGSATKREIEVKVRLDDREAFAAKLPTLGFRLLTPETLERNVLFDTADGQLHQRRQILRVRQYGSRWVLTHKAPVEDGTEGPHKVRQETETEIADGHALAAVFQRLGYEPIFIYEKLRAEWTDGEGHLVVDGTPIGDFAELEGEPDWIDRTSTRLAFSHDQYLTASYGQLFLAWKQATQHAAKNMTFEEIGPRK